MIKKLFFVAICCILTALFFLLSEKESTHAADQAQANETSQPSLPANNAAEPRNREASAATAATAATTFNSTAPTANVREKFPQRLIKPQIEEVDFSAIEAFSQWTKEWKKASPQERRVLETKGVELAIARRAHFKTLIQANPELALKNAVPIVDRQELPEPIIAQLE